MNKPVAVMDIEIYKDYLLVAFRMAATGEVVHYEMFDDHPLDVEAVRKKLRENLIITFNGINFDMPVLFAALDGGSVKKCKAVCDYIIQEGYKWWHAEKKFGFAVSQEVDHLDIFELLPLKASLKTYGGRLHTKTIQDLPFDPSASISPADRKMLRTYCANDLKLTQELYERLTPQIELRRQMSDAYGVNLLSKSDAAIAETIIKLEVEKVTKNSVPRPEVKEYAFRYKAPEFICFETPLLRSVLKTVLDAKFHVAGNGKVIMPEEIGKAKIHIGESTYAMGIGGLHSQEANVAHVAGKDEIISDWDVASYYPSIILQTGLYPPAMGRTFLSVYKRTYDERLAAKKVGNKTEADVKKIVLNSSYGKMSNQYSSLYAPELSIQVVMTGQLALLMLIERAEAAGVRVISANTDGIVMKYHKSLAKQVEGITAMWEVETGFELETSFYSAIYNISVNSYIAIKQPSGIKCKGTFTPPGITKNPANEISIEAAVRFLSEGTPVEKTVGDCRDIRKFVSVRNVKGGAVKDDVYLGKVVRFYYSRLAFDNINYKVNGYKVPRTEGAEPLMVLPDEFPCDVDFDWYIEEANKILSEVGVTCANRPLKTISSAGSRKKAASA